MLKANDIQSNPLLLMTLIFLLVDRCRNGEGGNVQRTLPPSPFLHLSTSRLLHHAHAAHTTHTAHTTRHSRSCTLLFWSVSDECIGCKHHTGDASRVLQG